MDDHKEPVKLLKIIDGNLYSSSDSSIRVWQIKQVSTAKFEWILISQRKLNAFK